RKPRRFWLAPIRGPNSPRQGNSNPPPRRVKVAAQRSEADGGGRVRVSWELLGEERKSVAWGSGAAPGCCRATRAIFPQGGRGTGLCLGRCWLACFGPPARTKALLAGATPRTQFAPPRQ